MIMPLLNEQDFVGCLDLNCSQFEGEDAPENETYQAIFASQVYGTFYVIYGRFKADRKSKAGCCVIKGVNMKLINYKGLVNIGFPKKSITAPVDYTKEKIQNVVEFETKGFCTNYDLEVIFERPFDVSENSSLQIVFQKKLLALSDAFKVDPQSQTQLQNTLKSPLKGRTVPNEPFFDTEFHYRDGVDYYDEVLRPGMDGYVPDTNEAFTIRCVTSNVNLVYYKPAAVAKKAKK